MNGSRPSLGRRTLTYSTQYGWESVSVAQVLVLCRVWKGGVKKNVRENILESVGHSSR